MCWTGMSTLTLCCLETKQPPFHFFIDDTMRTFALMFLFFVSSAVVAFEWFGTVDNPVWTSEQEHVIWMQITTSIDPFRDGTELVAEGIGDADSNDEIYYEEIESTQEARTKTADYVRALVNYALAAIWIVALLYLLYHGFLTATAGGNEEQEKKWREGIRYGAMALLGIAVAWFILSLVYRLLQRIT